MTTFEDGFYSLDTGFACGGVTIHERRVVARSTAPIFVKLFRRGLYTKPSWRWVRL